jgi:hypothetical protein
MRASRTTWNRVAMRTAALALAVLTAACGGGSDGDDGPAGPPGPVTPPEPPDSLLAPFEVPPGVNIDVVDVQGGSGTGGNVLPGDTITVVFTVKDDEGTDWPVTSMTRGEALVSGPTTNYQRVIPAQSDVVEAAVDLGGGMWSYTFATPFPSVYFAPINDSPSFGPADGEMTGEAVDDGTYTVGLRLYRDYTVEGESDSVRDPAATVHDFLVGAADTLDSRLVVADENCEVCHTEVRAHGEGRVGVRYCLLCHTSGAEDRNVLAVEGGTPGVSVDFRVMIHRIHAASHLPSVVGIGLNPDGTRNYTAAPEPLIYVGFNDSVIDLSDVAFPVWPSFNIDATRDKGYSTLSDTDPDGSAGPLLSPKGREQATLRGPLACAKCHGDPDGDTGPATEPEDGHRAWDAPSRRACGSCHDDLDYDNVYKVNTGGGMPAGMTDASCSGCHPAAGPGLSVEAGHTHPLLNPVINPGLKIAVTALVEAGTHDGDLTIDPGERIEVTVEVTNDAGAPIVNPAGILDSTTIAIAGPTWNYSLALYNQSLPVGLLPTSISTFRVPETIPLVLLGTAGAGADVLPAPRAPILTVTGAATTVWQRTGTSGGNTVLTAAGEHRRNFLDVVDPAGFIKDDYVVVDDGAGGEEYTRVQRVDGLRLWVSPVLRGPHAPGASVLEVQLTSKTLNTHYTIDGPGGQIVEAGTPFTTGQKVLMTYVSEFEMPAAYLPPFNDTPRLGENVGEWTGLAILSGTYTLDIWGYDNRPVTVPGGIPADQYTVRGTSSAGLIDFLVGDADTIEPYEVISEAANCYSCHNDLFFHGGGRRSLVTCLVCHGTSGGEYPNPFSTPAVPPIEPVSVAFREMIHKIHARSELTKDYPFGTEGFEFPAWPGGVKQCAKCHGNEAFHQPRDRSHPDGAVPARVYWVVCGSCHDSDTAHAHMDLNTSPSGHEACTVCHGPDDDLSPAKVHVVR